MLIAAFGSWLGDRGNSEARADSLEVVLNAHRSGMSPEEALAEGHKAFSEHAAALDDDRAVAAAAELREAQ